MNGDPLSLPKLDRSPLSRFEIHEPDGDPAPDEVEVLHLLSMVVSAPVRVPSPEQVEVAEMSEASTIFDESEFPPLLGQALLPPELPGHRKFLDLNLFLHGPILGLGGAPGGYQDSRRSACRRDSRGCEHA